VREENHPHLNPLPAYAKALADRPSRARKQLFLLFHELRLITRRERGQTQGSAPTITLIYNLRLTIYGIFVPTGTGFPSIAMLLALVTCYLILLTGIVCPYLSVLI